MKTFHYNSTNPCFPWFIIIFVLLVFELGITTNADTSKPEDTTETSLPIKITADSLKVSRETYVAEFIGNVVAYQGETRIKADRLKIHYSETANSQNNNSEDALKKIVAVGNVEIKFDNRLAVTNEAVYITEEKILTLTGPDTKITSGKDTISGEKITYYRLDGRFQVESGQQKRVEVTIFSSENGLN